jgi:hypothetical protein
VSHNALTEYAVGSACAWDVVESIQRTGRTATWVDSTGEAGPRMPGLTTEPGTEPFVLGPSSARHRPVAARAARDAGRLEPPLPCAGRPSGSHDEHSRILVLAEEPDEGRDT